MGAILSAPVDSVIVERAGCSQLRCAVATLQGWRCTHEDSHIMLQPPEKTPGPYLFSVMDGHGGDEAAREMHHLLPTFVDVASLPKVSAGNLAETVIERFKLADRALRDKLPESCSAGTTCTSALVSRHETEADTWDVTLANSGDSRSIVIHADGTFTATEDHKPDLPEETARIKRAGGFVSNDVGGPSRVDNNLAVSRAFGDFEYKDVSALAEDQKISCVPDVQHVLAKTGDIIFLACDGIFDVMSNEEVVEFILSHDRSDLGSVTAELLYLVLEKGSKDNCSAMIVDLDLVEKHKENDIIPLSTIVDSSRWDGWHTGYWTEQLIVGNLPPDDETVREKFKIFHQRFNFSDPLPGPCSNCDRLYMGMQVCSRCKQDIYCSHHCQKKDWKTKHKEKCNKAISEQGGNVASSPDKGKKKK